MSAPPPRLAEALTTRCAQCKVLPALKHPGDVWLFECLCMEKEGAELAETCARWIEACARMREAVARNEEAQRRRMKGRR